MQISHSFLRTGEAKCSSCIEMRGKPHSKVVSRRECSIRPAGKTSTSWKEMASATRTSTAASTAGLTPAGLVDTTRSPFAFAGGAPSKAGRGRLRAFRRTLVGRDALNRNSPLKDPEKTHLGSFCDPFLGRKKPSRLDERRVAYPKARFKPTERPSKGLRTVH